MNAPARTAKAIIVDTGVVTFASPTLQTRAAISGGGYASDTAVVAGVEGCAVM